MQPIADLKMLLLDILESVCQAGEVHATQQMGVSISSAMKRDGVVIVQNQNVEVYARIMPSMVKALKLCDAMASSRRHPMEVEVDRRPRQLSPPDVKHDTDPIEACCEWLFQNRVKWQEMQDYMRARYLEHVIGRFRTKSAAAKWLGVGGTYLCKLSRTVPRAARQDQLAEKRLMPS